MTLSPSLHTCSSGRPNCGRRQRWSMVGVTRRSESICIANKQTRGINGRTFKRLTPCNATGLADGALTPDRYGHGGRKELGGSGQRFERASRSVGTFSPSLRSLARYHATEASEVAALGNFLRTAASASSFEAPFRIASRATPPIVSFQ